MDGWTDFFHDGTGTKVSNDKTMQVPNALRWIAGPRYQDGNGGNGWRIDAGLAISEWNAPDDTKIFEGRDAFNGTVLWQRVVRTGPRSQKTKPLIQRDGKVYRIDESSPVWHLAVYDAASGEKIRTLKSSLGLSVDAPRRSSRGRLPSPDNVGFMIHDGLLYQIREGKLRCIDPEKDQALWTFDPGEERGEIWRPTVMPELGLIFLAE